MKTPSAGNRTSYHRQRHSKYHSVRAFSRDSDERIKKTGSSTKKMVIGRGADSPTLKEHPSRKSEPTNEIGEVNTVYKPGKRKVFQMRIHGTVKSNDEERPKHDRREGVKKAEAYVERKDEFIAMLSDFESISEDHLGGVTIAKFERKIILAVARLFFLHHSGQVQKLASLTEINSTKCCEREW